MMDPVESPSVSGVSDPADAARTTPNGGARGRGPATTPPSPTPVPDAAPDGTHDLSDPGYYLNRELTWLNFNYRVLREAEDARTPLLERVKFLSIVSSNLDEFFMKRIGGLKQQVGAGITRRTIDGRTPAQQIDDAHAVVRDLLRRKRQTYLDVRNLLADAEIVVSTYEDLSADEQREVSEAFLEDIYPLVTPQATDPAHPFPFISNLSLNLLVSLRHPGDPERLIARVKVPVGAGIPRFLKLKDQMKFVTLESVMANHLDDLFPGMQIEDCAVFRVTRNANTEVDEERAEDLLSMIESGLRERHFAPIVRLEVAAGMRPELLGMLAAELGLRQEQDVFEVHGLIGMRDIMELLQVPRPDLKYAHHHAIDQPELASERNIFHVIRSTGPFLVHHPYESFQTSVEKFLREAARDPKVRAIKMTLYRTSEDSKALEYLMDAARNGKQVAVVVELKARFDEAANIRWANKLERAGIHVTYGVVGLKTHCKAILVVRRDYDGVRRYAHIGTGNYHAGTARLYCDFGLLTGDAVIGSDLTELFNYLTTGFKPRRNYQKLLPAPKLLKRALLEKIAREVSKHSTARPGRIQLKMNALEDAEVTRALYEAARAGVHVDLIVRDSCRLRPGIGGLSETIRVVSIVGRFLEHARVYYFQNGGDEEYYIGSADAMRRNLDSRVEVLAPVEDDELRDELRQVLDLQMGDQRSAWVMQADGSYTQRVPASPEQAESCQNALIRLYEARAHEAGRLRRRKLRGIQRRNLR